MKPEETRLLHELEVLRDAWLRELSEDRERMSEAEVEKFRTAIDKLKGVIVYMESNR